MNTPMHPNVAALILAGATPVEMNPTQKLKPARIGAMSSCGRRVLGKRSAKVDGGWIPLGWACWDVDIPEAYRALVDWDHPDAQWNQIPPEVLAEFAEGS